MKLREGQVNRSLAIVSWDRNTRTNGRVVPKTQKSGSTGRHGDSRLILRYFVLNNALAMITIALVRDPAMLEL
ncbi:hypothetical protein BDW67DRAFT_163282 [Aspergillus spinulosporus]